MISRKDIGGTLIGKYLFFGTRYMVSVVYCTVVFLFLSMHVRDR